MLIYHTFFLLVILLNGIPSTLIANSNTTSPPCILIFDRNCVIDTITPLITSSNVQHIKIQTSIARLAIELNHTERNQIKTWAYRYRAIHKTTITNSMLASPARDIWNTITQFAISLAQAPKQEFKSDRCFSELKAPSKHYLTSLFCTHTAVTTSPETALKQTIVQSLTDEQYIALLYNLHKLQIANGDLEQAERTINIIVSILATYTNEKRSHIKLKVVEHYLGFGLHDIAIDILEKLTPSISEALLNNEEKIYYKVWAHFLNHARFYSSTYKNNTNNNHKNITALLQSKEHQHLLSTLKKMPIAHKLKTHRLIAQGFFYTLFNSSPSHDLVLIYHLDEWSRTWANAPKKIQLEEGLEMLFLELRIGSLLDHQKLIYMNNSDHF